MGLAIQQWKVEDTARRFVVWMAIGLAFVMALVAADYFSNVAIW